MKNPCFFPPCFSFVFWKKCLMNRSQIDKYNVILHLDKNLLLASVALNIFGKIQVSSSYLKNISFSWKKKKNNQQTVIVIRVLEIVSLTVGMPALLSFKDTGAHAWDANICMNSAFKSVVSAESHFGYCERKNSSPRIKSGHRSHYWLIKFQVHFKAWGLQTRLFWVLIESCDAASVFRLDRLWKQWHLGWIGWIGNINLN